MCYKVFFSNSDMGTQICIDFFCCSLIGSKFYPLAAAIVINLDEPFRKQRKIRVPTHELELQTAVLLLVHRYKMSANEQYKVTLSKLITTIRHYCT